MIFIAIITILLFLVVIALFIGVVIGILDYFSVKLVEKPIYIHFYPVKLDLPISKHQVIKNHFAFYNRLAPKQQHYFRHRVVKFMKHYQFIAKEDLVLTEDMKIILASTAVKLTFGMRKYLLDVFDKIIIYPTPYYSTVNDAWHKGEFNPRMRAIVFSWEDFMEGINVDNDNYNLGLHEFTHAIHFHSKRSDDISALLFSEKFNRIIAFISQPHVQKRLEDASYLRPYAYTNQFEFMAVLMEHFFETPNDLKRDFPELYEKVRKMINFQEKP
ncbi:MAG: zinc-dependent peptidase [Flavobacteriales bacterium]|nr:zinc-dependent peptidase [Flavobacteriales bacterium]